MTVRWYDRGRVALSAIGLAVAAYLTLLHYDSDVPLVCTAGSLVNCEAVLTSASSVVLGVPVAVWGLLWFVVALALGVLMARARKHGVPSGMQAASLAWTLVGTATVLWLVYQEIGVIGKICAWCTVVHVLVLALLVVEVQAYRPEG